MRRVIKREVRRVIHNEFVKLKRGKPGPSFEIAFWSHCLLDRTIKKL